MTQRVVILGAGGHGVDTLDVFEADNAARPGTWELLGFVSELEADHGRTIAGLPVLGGFDRLAGRTDVRVVAAVGDPALRRRLVERATALGLGFATVVHPTAVVPARAAVGIGAIVSAGVLVTGSARIGDHVVLNLGCTVAHDCVLADFVTLAPGVHLSGHVHVGTGADLGTGAVVLPRVEIGAGAIVGAGAVVRGSLAANVTAVGVPARVIATRGDGGDGADGA